MTFKNAQQLRDAIAVAPLDLLLVETDAPFLTPLPHRGAPNAPYLIPVTVRAMAQAAGVELEAMCAAIAANSERVVRRLVISSRSQAVSPGIAFNGNVRLGSPRNGGLKIAN